MEVKDVILVYYNIYTTKDICLSWLRKITKILGQYSVPHNTLHSFFILWPCKNPDLFFLKKTNILH